jgi:hypothetical protein
MVESTEVTSVLAEATHYTTTSKVLFWCAMAALAIGVLGGIFPPWKSAKLSPASIRRRFYWTGCATATMLLFVAVLPDWRSATFVALACGVLFVGVAFFRTSHLKIGDRIWAGYDFLRRPDPPPARWDEAP